MGAGPWNNQPSQGEPLQIPYHAGPFYPSQLATPLSLGWPGPPPMNLLPEPTTSSQTYQYVMVDSVVPSSAPAEHSSSIPYITSPPLRRKQRFDPLAPSRLHSRNPPPKYQGASRPCCCQSSPDSIPLLNWAREYRPKAPTLLNLTGPADTTSPSPCASTASTNAHDAEADEASVSLAPSSATAPPAALPQNLAPSGNTPTKKNGEKKPPLACLFCRGRKIACGPPIPGGDDHTCK